MPRRSHWVLLALVAAALLAPALFARAEDAAPAGDLPKPPDTPLPSFENPLADCQVGETLLYRVRDIEREDGWVRYFEERVLARTKDRALLETVETDATGTKDFGIDNTRTGWRPIPEALPMPPSSRWLEDRTKDAVLYIGSPPTRAVRCVLRVREEPVDFSRPDGEKRQRRIWFSHDVPCSGVVKLFPAQRDGERMAVSWDKRLPAEECARRAARYPDQEAASTPIAPSAGGMDEAKPEPGMDEPKPEPGMDEPKPEPGMDEPKPEPGMDEPPK